MIDPIIVSEISLCGDLTESEFDSLRELVFSFLSISSDIPPLGILLSLGKTFSESFQSSSETISEIQKYEEWVLHRINVDPLIQTFRAKLSSSAPHIRTMQIAVLIDMVLDRIGYKREISFLSIRETLGSTLRNLRQEESLFIEQTLEEYKKIAELGKKIRKLILPEDLLVLDFPETFQKKSQRIFFRLLSEKSLELENLLPKKVKKIKKAISNASQQEESAFPSGGYSTITNSGDVESLLSSELVYMEEGDLFSIRWASGELLKYTRDESIVLRPRREIHLFLGDSLTELSQLAEVVAGVRKLLVWIGNVDLSIKIHYGKNQHVKYLKQIFSPWVSLIEFISDLSIPSFFPQKTEVDFIYMGVPCHSNLNENIRVHTTKEFSQLFIGVAEL